MVTKFGRYFGSPFKVQLGTTQGYPITPTIFNVVVDAVLRYHVNVMTAADGTSTPYIESFGQYIQMMEEYLYSVKRLLASTLKHIYRRSSPS